MPEIDHERLMYEAIRDGIREGVKSKMLGFNSPLDKLMADSFSKHMTTIREMLESSIASCVNDPSFRDNIATAVRSHLAKTLIQRFGGEIEKQVNILKSDPITRARITLAIEEIVKSQT